MAGSNTPSIGHDTPIIRPWSLTGNFYGFWTWWDMNVRTHHKKYHLAQHNTTNAPKKCLSANISTLALRIAIVKTLPNILFVFSKCISSDKTQLQKTMFRKWCLFTSKCIEFKQWLTCTHLKRKAKQNLSPFSFRIANN